MSAECSPQKSEALGGAGTGSSSTDGEPNGGAGARSSPTESESNGGADLRPAAGPNGTSSSRGPSQSRGRRTTLLVLVPSSVSGPSLSTPRRPSVAERRR